jgi:hypothetical protein
LGFRDYLDTWKPDPAEEEEKKKKEAASREAPLSEELCALLLSSCGNL